LGISRNTASKFASGDPKELSETGLKIGKLDPYIDEILLCLNHKKSKSETWEYLQSIGYNGSRSSSYEYFQKIEHITGIDFALQPYMRNKTTTLSNKRGSLGNEHDYITRAGVFQYLWLNGELTTEHKEYIFNLYPALYPLKKSIQDFRQVFNVKSMPLLYLYIEEYSKSEIRSLKSFASGLSKDIKAVENAVASDLSNGFVEGLNSKLKMVKRTMYGRCGIELLSAKMMLRL
jgi:hypothetical protein